MTQPLLSILNLTINIDQTPIIRDISINLYPGEIYGLIGESGAGKTQIVNAIMGLCSHNVTGAFQYKQTPLHTLPASKRQKFCGRDISLIVQDPHNSLHPLFTLGQHMMDTLKIHRPTLPKHQRQAKALKYMKLVGLPTPERRFYQYPHQLSGGMKQRFIIALALISHPSVLIADEPTTALDLSTQIHILDLLQSACRTHNKAMLFVSHDLNLITKFSDRIGVLCKGKLVEEQKTADLLNDPQHDYTKFLLSCRQTIPSAQVLS
jgi:ABC-type glutathione transport system ATPase component